MLIWLITQLILGNSMSASTAGCDTFHSYCSTLRVSLNKQYYLNSIMV